MTGELENKEQTARKELESFRRRSKLLDRDERVSKETREETRKVQNKEQNRSKGTSDFQNKEQASCSETAREFRKRLENFHTRSKTARRNYRIFGEGANRSKESRECRRGLEKLRTKSKIARMELESFRRRSKPLERD